MTTTPSVTPQVSQDGVILAVAGAWIVAAGRELEVEAGGSSAKVCAGETLRYRCDMPHRIRNLSARPARATMVCILKAAMMD